MRLSLYDSVESRNSFYAKERNVSIPWAVITTWRAFKPTPPAPTDAKQHGAIALASEVLIPRPRLASEQPGVLQMLLHHVIPRIAIFKTYQAAKSYSNMCLLRQELAPVLLTLDDFVIEDAGISCAARATEYRFAQDVSRRTERVVGLLNDTLATAVVGIVLGYEQLVQSPTEPPAV